MFQPNILCSKEAFLEYLCKPICCLSDLDLLQSLRKLYVFWGEVIALELFRPCIYSHPAPIHDMEAFTLPLIHKWWIPEVVVGHSRWANTDINIPTALEIWYYSLWNLIERHAFNSCITDVIIYMLEIPSEKYRLLQCLLFITNSLETIWSGIFQKTLPWT